MLNLPPRSTDLDQPDLAHPNLSAPDNGAELVDIYPPSPGAETPPDSDNEQPANANASAGAIARNALFGYLATAIGAFTGLMVTPLLLHHLGATQFGLWVLLFSTAGYVGLLEVGLYITVSKRVA